MRKWPYVAIAVVPPLVFLAGCAFELRAFGEEIGKAMGDAFATAIRIAGRSTPDLEVKPGSVGYLSSLRVVGSQLHYYGKQGDETFIAGDVPIGDEVMHLPVARYTGPPSREVRERELRPVDVSWAILVVTVVDSEGFGRGRVGVHCKSIRGTSSTSQRTNWSRCDADEVRFVLSAGTYALSVEGDTAREVTLRAREKVWCTLAPSGLTVNERK